MESHRVSQKEQKQRNAAVDPANKATIESAATANAATATPAVDAATRIPDNDFTAVAKVTLILSGKSLRRQHRRGGRRALVGGSPNTGLELDAADIHSLTRSLGKVVRFSEDG